MNPKVSWGLFVSKRLVERGQGYKPLACLILQTGDGVIDSANASRAMHPRGRLQAGWCISRCFLIGLVVDETIAIAVFDLQHLEKVGEHPTVGERKFVRR
jgi:hypothetical protein